MVEEGSAEKGKGHGRNVVITQVCYLGLVQQGADL